MLGPEAVAPAYGENRSDQSDDAQQAQASLNHEEDHHEDHGGQRAPVVEPVGDGRAERRVTAGVDPALLDVAPVGLQVDVHEDPARDGERQDRGQRVEQVDHVDGSECQAADQPLSEVPSVRTLAPHLLLVEGGLVEQAVGVRRLRASGPPLAPLHEQDEQDDERAHDRDLGQAEPLSDLEVAGDDRVLEPRDVVDLKLHEADEAEQHGESPEVVGSPKPLAQFPEAVRDVPLGCGRHREQLHEQAGVDAALRSLEDDRRLAALPHGELDSAQYVVGVVGTVSVVVVLVQDLGQLVQLAPGVGVADAVGAVAVEVQPVAVLGRGRCLELDLAAVLRVQPRLQAGPVRVGRVDDDAAETLELEALRGWQDGRCRVGHGSSWVEN